MRRNKARLTRRRSRSRVFGGARVMEIVERYRTDAYRAVYTVQFSNAVYVLHVFQKEVEAGHRDPRSLTLT